MCNLRKMGATHAEKTLHDPRQDLLSPLPCLLQQSPIPSVRAMINPLLPADRPYRMIWNLHRIREELLVSSRAIR